MITLTHIVCYPFKSAHGIALERSTVEARGLAWDRRWMAVDVGGRFLSQRTHPRLAQITPRFETDTLVLSAPGMARELALPLRFHSPYRRNVTVWDDLMSALHVNSQADAWISELLGETAGIVYFPDDSLRLVDERYASRGEHTAFSDGFPVLVMSQASLDDLNSRLASPLPLDRFRANLVFGGCTAFEEDTWTHVRINNVELAVVKPCARCVITTIDQETMQASEEPLHTLALYRKKEHKLLFGQNALVVKTGELARGDAVEVVLQGERSRPS